MIIFYKMKKYIQEKLRLKRQEKEVCKELAGRIGLTTRMYAEPIAASIIRIIMNQKRFYTKYALIKMNPEEKILQKQN